LLGSFLLMIRIRKSSALSAEGLVGLVCWARAGAARVEAARTARQRRGDIFGFPPVQGGCRRPARGFDVSPSARGGEPCPAGAPGAGRATNWQLTGAQSSSTPGLR